MQSGGSNCNAQLRFRVFQIETGWNSAKRGKHSFARSDLGASPVKKEDEDKRGGVKDAGGTTWWMATKVEEVKHNSFKQEKRNDSGVHSI